MNAQDNDKASNFKIVQDALPASLAVPSLHLGRRSSQSCSIPVLPRMNETNIKKEPSRRFVNATARGRDQDASSELDISLGDAHLPVRAPKNSPLSKRLEIHARGATCSLSPVRSRNVRRSVVDPEDIAKAGLRTSSLHNLPENEVKLNLNGSLNQASCILDESFRLGDATEATPQAACGLRRSQDDSGVSKFGLRVSHSSVPHQSARSLTPPRRASTVSTGQALAGSATRTDFDASFAASSLRNSTLRRDSPMTDQSSGSHSIFSPASMSSSSDPRMRAGVRSSLTASAVMGDSSFGNHSRRVNSDARVKAGLRDSTMSDASYSSQATFGGAPHSSIASDNRTKAGLRTSASTSRSPRRTPPASLTLVPPPPQSGSPPGSANSNRQFSKTAAGLRRSSHFEDDSDKFSLRVSRTSTNSSSADTAESTMNETVASRPGAYRGSVVTTPDSSRRNQQDEFFFIQRMDSLHKGGMEVLGREGQSADYQDSFADLSFNVDPSEWDDGPGVADLESQSKRISPLVADVQAIMEVDEENDTIERKIKKMLWFAMGLIVIVGLVGAVVGVVVHQSSKNHTDGNELESSSNPTSTQSISGLEEIFEDPVANLPAETIVAVQFGNENDPRVQAFNWIRSDPSLSQYTKRQLKQRFALAIFYFATNGDGWFDGQKGQKVEIVWLDYEAHECMWYASWPTESQPACATFNAASAAFDHHDYTSLVLRGNDEWTDIKDGRKPVLKGTIVPELSLLTSLQRLDVGAQSLEGIIPPQLEILSHSLKDIVLYNNLLTGKIPQSFYSHTERLWLSRNTFAPSFIPPTIGTQLTSLGLTDAQITGSIPSQLFALPNIKEVYLSFNNLGGPLPSEVGLVGSSLQRLELFHNQLSSSLVTEMGLLTQLTGLSLASNRIEGTIPKELGTLEQLTSLNLLGNQFTNLPTELARLSGLEELKLSSIQLKNDDIQGTIPLEFFLAQGDIIAPTWPRLKLLWLSGTKISGTIPTQVGLLSALEELRLGWNYELTGSTIPSEIGRLTNLKDLGLAESSLVSTIPTELGFLSNLQFLRLQSNDLSGSVPTELHAVAVTLKEFRVDENEQLEGSIPAFFCDIKDLHIGCGEQGSTNLCGCDCPCP